MDGIDYGSPHQVLSRLAAIRIESEARLGQIAILEQQQGAADAEWGDLARVARLYLEDSETAVKVSVYLPDEHQSRDYVVSRSGPQIEVCRLAYLHDLPSVSAGDLAAALAGEPEGDTDEPPVLTARDALREAAATFMADDDQDELDAIADALDVLLTTDGRRFHVANGEAR